MKTASNKLRAGKHPSLISFTSPKQCTHCVLDKKAFSKNISDPFNMNPKFMKFSMFIYKIRWCVSIQKVSPHFCQDPDKTTTAAWLQPLHFLNTTILKCIVYNWKNLRDCPSIVGTWGLDFLLYLIPLVFFQKFLIF